MYALTYTVLLGLSLQAAASPVIDPRQSSQQAFSPPWYPSPAGGTSKSWAAAYQKAAALVSQMTVPEKVNVTTGLGNSMGLCVGNTGPVPRLGFPSLCLQDGPLGVRMADKITAFPAGITIAGTWDKELYRQRGEGMGAEFRGKGVHIMLGPCMGPLGNHPAGGRNWEGFGSDPYLQGIASGETITGIQSQGVVATAKHFIANEQEHFRGGVNAISSNIDDRTLHEVYLWPFQDSVKAGVGAVMCSYNKVNNSAACQNSWLQNNVLKDQLGFQGFIMSDWLAQMSGVASLLSGMDMSMPGDGYYWDDRNPMLGPRLTESIVNGSLPISRLDDMVTRIVATWYHFGQDKGYPEINFSSHSKSDYGPLYPGSNNPEPSGHVNYHVNVMGNHPQLSRKIAADATALLKNDKDTLPLKKPMKIGIYGEDAALMNPGGANGCGDRGCNKGTLAVGWGSGSTDFEYLVDPLSAITKKAESYGGKVSSILFNNATAQMAEDAKKQDICIAFINADSGEGYMTWEDVVGDRPNLNTQNHGDEVVMAVAANCANTVVVVHTVGPIILEKWIDNPNVRSVVWAHLPGIESGNALVDVLFGDVNPSGKLPYTIGKSLADYGPAAGIIYDHSQNSSPQQDFIDGVFVDYRYFDKNNITPRYEFGFGMSYTTFKFGQLVTRTRAPISALPDKRPTPEAQPPVYHSTIPKADEVLFPPGFTKINRMIYPWLTAANVTKGPYPYPDGFTTKQPLSEAGGAEGGNPSLWEVLATVSTTVTNTGKVAGAEVAQLYLAMPQVGSITFPLKQLRGFQKVLLQPGETKQVTFDLTRRDLSYWDTVRQNWVIPGPAVGVMVGSSSRAIKCQGVLQTVQNGQSDGKGKGKDQGKGKGKQGKF